MKRFQNGFTIIEILIIIVVIAILATLVLAVFPNVQKQANDTKLRDAAVKVKDALLLWSANHDGGVPNGGWATAETNSYSSANENCVGGLNGYLPPSNPNPNYRCSVGDVLVNSGYLPAKLFDDLPPNGTEWGNRASMMLYRCVDQNHAVLMTSLELPDASDKKTFESTVTDCLESSYVPVYRGYGMEYAVLVEFD